MNYRMRNYLFAALRAALVAVGVSPDATRAQSVRKYTAQLKDSQVHDRQIIVELDTRAGR